MEDYVELDAHEQQRMAELVDRHLMSDADGKFPLSSLNDWEREVVKRELRRPECIAWYRNPARAAVDSLGITYRDIHGNWRSMHPDFIFFEEVDGEVRPSIVDPHGHHLDDAEMKLKGLALFAEQYGDEFHRIWAVTKIGTVMQILDMKIEMTRKAILAGGRSPIELYQSDVAVIYSPDGSSHS